MTRESGRKEKNNPMGSWGAVLGCVLEELTALTPRIAEGKKKQRIVLLQNNTKAS